jgi:isoquinoline 1-oxidoreductase subunit beta
MARFQRQTVEEEEALPLSRRDFLIGMAGAAVAFGFARAGAVAAATPAFDPTIWYSIDRDGIVTVNIIRAEMGQHVGTALARILAEELEADWNKVRIVAVDTDPKWGLMVTGGSWSVWMTFPVFSRAGAAGRIALVEEGAKLLGVPAGQCVARNSSIVAGNRSISYAEIVQRGNLTRTFTADELAKMPIKPAAQRRLLGHKVNAIDIPEKTNGTARYGIDAAVEGMVYARPKIPPTRNGARVRSIDDSAARSVKGYISSLALEDPSDTVPGWVMVFASSYPAAVRAADLVKVDWVAGDGASVSERDILDHGAKQIADPKGGVLLVDDPGLEAAFQHASSTLEQTYTTGSAARAHRDAHLFARRRLRSAIERRLHRAGCACCQGSRQAGEDGADAPRRHALRFVPLAIRPDPAHGVCNRWKSRGDGASRVRRVAHGRHGTGLHGEGIARHAL